MSCLCRVRDYQSDDTDVSFANSWLLPNWDGVQVIGRISDGGDISYGVEELPPTLPLSPETIDISVPETDADVQLPPFNPTLAGQWVEDEAEAATPISTDPRRLSASPVEQSHRMGKRLRDDE